MKRLLFILTLIIISLTLFTSLSAHPEVTDLRAAQRNDTSKRVDIYYNIEHNRPVTITIQASSDNGESWDLSCRLVTGDVGENISPGRGKHIVWDVLTEHPNISGDEFRFQVTANDIIYGLIAYYPLNGNANDESGNGNHGTIHGTTLTNDRFDNINRAYYFGGNSYINIGQLPQLANADAITVSCWVKKTTRNRVEGFVGKWNTSPGNRNVFLLYNGEGTYVNKAAFCIQYSSNNRGSTAVQGTTDIPLNEWVHIVGVWRNSDGFIALYKNGSLENYQYDQNSIDHSIYYNTSTTSVLGNWGTLWGSNYYMRGDIDDVRIYNRALSAYEIQELFNEGGWGE